MPRPASLQWIIWRPGRQSTDKEQTILRHTRNPMPLFWQLCGMRVSPTSCLVRPARDVRRCDSCRRLRGEQGRGAGCPVDFWRRGLLYQTNGGATSYQPHIEPLIAAPIGQSLLFESRAIILQSFFPSGGGQPGYSHSHFADLLYMQGDYMASRHLTVVGGSFLLPFNTYNDRLSEIWIGNLQDGPLLAGLGTMSTGTGVGRL